MEVVIEIIKVVYLGFLVILDYLGNIDYFGPIIISLIGLVSTITIFRALLGTNK